MITRLCLCVILVTTVALACVTPAWAMGKGEGSDLEFGGFGDGQGKFARPADIAFDGAGNLYVLDGGDASKKDPAEAGNFLVQKFDNAGKFLSQFSLKDEQLGAKNSPTRLAVDSRGHVYVAQPRAGLVREYAPDGKLAKDFAIPGAYALAVRKMGGKEQVIVIARGGERLDKPVSEAQVIQEGSLGPTIPLERPINNGEDVAADGTGNLYVLADVHQIHKFGPAGKLVTIIGGGTNLRLEDGSELYHTVALDSKGNIYSITSGNPGWVTRFDAGVTTVTRRKGQFTWCDPWGVHGGYTPFAIDPSDRLWVGAVGKCGDQPEHHYRPCVLRAEASFIGPGAKQAAVSSALVLGLNLAVETKLPYNVTCELAPVSAEFVVKAGVRRVQELDVSYHVYDAYKNEAAKGSFALKLKDGEESRQAVSFTPARWGWYSVQFQAAHKGERLTGLACHVGATPKFAGMPVLAPGESPGGTEDAPRQAFTGLNLMRVHPKPGNLEQIEKTIDAAAKFGLTLIAQFEGKDQCTPDFVRQTVARFKGRVKFWEIMNEPNFTFKPDVYGALVKQLYPIIKGIDPEVKVLAPTVCGINLDWHEQFYKAAGKDSFDILSIHDYEGHESVDPWHWWWKMAALRKLMASHGDGDKPIWQTERAVGGIRGKNFLGTCQAVRVTLHEDLLASLGIPAEHNLHYYLNDHGYGSVPTFLWSRAGPHPGALATRTRQAMIQGRRLAEVLDLGPTGKKIFMVLHYKGDDGSTIILRNLGTLDRPLELGVKGGDSVEAVDAFGNSEKLPVKGGKVALAVSSLPTYLCLAKGQEVAVPRIDFGRNIAGLAKFTYSATAKGDFALLASGIMETVHAGHPSGGTDGKAIWTGDLPALPQTLEMTFEQPQTVSRLLLFGVRPDNQFCALLDYDLECHDGKGWVTLQKVRTPLPESEAVETPQCRSVSWDKDENFHVSEFKPVTTNRLRLVVHRTTFGFFPDEAARRASGSDMPGKLMLREVEIYGPTSP